MGGVFFLKKGGVVQSRPIPILLLALTSLNLHGDVQTFVVELSCRKKPLKISDMLGTVSIRPTINYKI